VKFFYNNKHLINRAPLTKKGQARYYFGRTSQSDNFYHWCLVDEKAQKRREDILKASTEFFATSGYRNTDVQQIADKLQLGKGTIYRYFPSKEALFFASVDRSMLMMEEYVKSKVQKVTGDMQRIRMVIASYLKFFIENPHFIELFVQERAEFRQRDVSTFLSHRAHLSAEWKAMFQRLQSDGKLRMANFDLIIDYITNNLYGIMFTNALQGKQPRMDETIDMLLYGIFKETS
jgi:AcrR family transcriptional regulator